MAELEALYWLNWLLALLSKMVYYDLDLGEHSISSDDFPKIEEDVGTSS